MLIRVEVYNSYKHTQRIGDEITLPRVPNKLFIYLFKQCSIVKEVNDIIKYNRKIFNKIDSREKAYWIGFIVADGYINESRGFLRIKLGNKDKQHLIKFINFIEGDINMLKHECHSITHNDIWYVSLYGKSLVNDLVKLNIRQAKSTKEKVPPINSEYYIDFIRGLIDGDGYIRKDMTGIGLCGSKDILKFCQDIFLHKLNVESHKIHDHCNTWKIEYRNKESIYKIIKTLYYNNCVGLDRKIELANTYINNYIK